MSTRTQFSPYTGLSFKNKECILFPTGRIQNIPVIPPNEELVSSLAKCAPDQVDT